jgi:sugar lactone lactonase YvrE
MLEPRVILDGRAFVESPRWHDGRLWFADWGTNEVIAVDADGGSEVVASGPGGFGWTIDWLPDGRLLLTGRGLLRREPDGSLVAHTDLAAIADNWNEVVVDGRGNVYVNGGISFEPVEGTPPGVIALVRPDGAVTQVADGLAFPNGMAITPDNRTLIVAESYGERLTAYDIGDDGALSRRRIWASTPGDHPDGVCLDADGAAWYADVGNAQCVRVREGGEALETVALDRGAFACMLGGADGRKLFIVAAEWRGMEGVEATIAERTGEVLVVDAPAPHAGWP